MGKWLVHSLGLAGWLGLKEVRGGGDMGCFDFGWLGKWVSVQCNFPGLAFWADVWLQGVSLGLLELKKVRGRDMGCFHFGWLGKWVSG